jgi:hypothetical protein
MEAVERFLEKSAQKWTFAGAAIKKSPQNLWRLTGFAHFF